jgi:AraC family transcriptional regulator
LEQKGISLSTKNLPYENPSQLRECQFRERGAEDMRGFHYFVGKIPPNIYGRTRTVFSQHVALFLPESYVVGQKMNVEEYHFVVCFETPPLATINGEDYQFKKGSLICLTPGDDILVHPPSSTRTPKYMALCVLPEFMNEVYRELGGEGALRFGTFDSRYSHLLLEAVDALIHEVLNHGDSSPLMIASLENRLVIQLIRDGKPSLCGPGTQGGYSHLDDLVQKACKYIETYYTSNITIKDISDAVYVSPSYLQRIFSKTVGKTPHQYIMECRHRKARELLLKTKASM